MTHFGSQSIHKIFVQKLQLVINYNWYCFMCLPEMIEEIFSTSIPNFIFLNPVIFTTLKFIRRITNVNALNKSSYNMLLHD